MHKLRFESRNKLDNSERRKIFPPIETLKTLGLTSGKDMADIGTGIGYFAIPASRIVGSSNRVYALDISKDMLSEVDRKIDKEKIENIETIKTNEYDLVLEDSLVDFVLLVNVLHEVDDKERFLSEIKRITKKDGELALIDFKGKRVNNEGPPEKNRVELEEASKLLSEAGYEILETFDFSESFYGLRGRLLA